MVPATLVQDFRENFPELDDSATNADIQQAGKVAAEIVHGTDMQYLYAVAHIVSSKDADLSGDTMSVRVGNVQRNYRTISASAHDVFWSTTSYGRLYLTLLRQTPVTGAPLMAVY